MLQKKTKYAVAVAGAGSVVAAELIEVLEGRGFPVSEMLLLDVDENAGERIEFQGKSRSIKKLEKGCFGGVDIVFFMAHPDSAAALAPDAVQSGAIVIDCTGAFRNDPNVPVVVPELNPDAVRGKSRIVASPAPSAIAAALVLKPVHDAVRIRRMVTTMLLSVSETGKRAIDELARQTVSLLNFRDVETAVYPHQIAFNCLPQIDAFVESGATGEEENFARETRKLLGDDTVQVAATAVRVPVFRCHSASVSIETEKPATANEVRALVSSAAGVVVYDDPRKNLYPTPLEAAGRDEIFVGRIREDGSVRNGISLWIVSDNLRKGSALNAVQIAELLIS